MYVNDATHIAFVRMNNPINNFSVKQGCSHCLLGIDQYGILTSLISHSKTHYEPPHEKSNNLHMRNQRCRSASQFADQLINAFVFATRIVQLLFFLNLKFPASSHLLCLYSSICVRPVQKPHYWFSHDAALLCLTHGHNPAPVGFKPRNF